MRSGALKGGGEKLEEVVEGVGKVGWGDSDSAVFDQLRGFISHTDYLYVVRDI